MDEHGSDHGHDDFRAVPATRSHELEVPGPADLGRHATSGAPWTDPRQVPVSQPHHAHQPIPQRFPRPQHPYNPYAPPRPPQPSIVTGESAGATTVQQVTVNVPTAGGRTNSLAMIAILAALFWVFWIGSVIAVLCGFLARKQIRENGNVERGDGLALAAIILGGLELIPAALLIFGVLAAAGGAAAGAGI